MFKLEVELVITDANWEQFIGDANGILPADHPHSGGEARMMGLRPRWQAYGDLPFAQPVHLAIPLIPRDEWDDRIAEKDKDGSWAWDILTAAGLAEKDQNGLGYCWVYGPTQAVEGSRVLQNEGIVTISAESVGGPVRNWVNEGGWGSEALKQYADIGGCDASFMDKPNSLNPSKWKAGWEAECGNHRVTWLDGTLSGRGCPERKVLVTDVLGRTLRANNFDVAVSCALAPRPLLFADGFNWWSHEVAGGYRVRKASNGLYEVMHRNQWKDYGDKNYFWMQEGRKGTPDEITPVFSTVPSIT